MVDVTSDCDSDLLPRGHLSGLSPSSTEHHHYFSVIFQAHNYLDMFYPPLMSSCSAMPDSVTPWTAAHQVPLSFTASWS